MCLWRFRLVLWRRRMLLGRCGATPVPYSETRAVCAVARAGDRHRGRPGRVSLSLTRILGRCDTSCAVQPPVQVVDGEPFHGGGSLAGVGELQDNVL